MLDWNVSGSQHQRSHCQRGAFVHHPSYPWSATRNSPRTSILPGLHQPLPEWVSWEPRLFADDCLLYREINNQSNAETLQQDLDHLQHLDKTGLMEFAEEKCQILWITKKYKRNTIMRDHAIHGYSLQAAREGKYLEVNLQGKLSFTLHINNNIKTASTTRHFLQRNLQGCSKMSKISATGHLKDRWWNMPWQYGTQLEIRPANKNWKLNRTGVQDSPLVIIDAPAT